MRVIKKLHTREAIISQGFSTSFSTEKGTTIEAYPELGGFIINNKTFIPNGNVTEIVFEIVSTVALTTESIVSGEIDIPQVNLDKMKKRVRTTN